MIEAEFDSCKETDRNSTQRQDEVDLTPSNFDIVEASLKVIQNVLQQGGSGLMRCDGGSSQSLRSSHTQLTAMGSLGLSRPSQHHLQQASQAVYSQQSQSIPPTHSAITHSQDYNVFRKFFIENLGNPAATTAAVLDRSVTATTTATENSYGSASGVRNNFVAGGASTHSDCNSASFSSSFSWTPPAQMPLGPCLSPSASLGEGTSTSYRNRMPLGMTMTGGNLQAPLIFDGEPHLSLLSSGWPMESEGAKMTESRSVFDANAESSTTAALGNSQDSPIQEYLVDPMEPHFDPSKAAAGASARRCRSQFAKTKLCPQVVRGQCADGASCSYAHSKEELKPLPDLRWTKLCDHWKNPPCPNPYCNYAHSVEELRCSTDFASYKTTFCLFWLKSRCYNGDKCRFAHGPTELRRPFRDGVKFDHLELEDMGLDATSNHISGDRRSGASNLQRFHATSPSKTSSPPDTGVRVPCPARPSSPSPRSRNDVNYSRLLPAGSMPPSLDLSAANVPHATQRLQASSPNASSDITKLLAKLMSTLLSAQTPDNPADADNNSSINQPVTKNTCSAIISQPEPQSELHYHQQNCSGVMCSSPSQCSLSRSIFTAKHIPRAQQPRAGGLNKSSLPPPPPPPPTSSPMDRSWDASGDGPARSDLHNKSILGSAAVVERPLDSITYQRVFDYCVNELALASKFSGDEIVSSAQDSTTT